MQRKTMAAGKLYEKVRAGREYVQEMKLDPLQEGTQSTVTLETGEGRPKMDAGG